MSDHVALTVITAGMLCLCPSDQPVLNALLLFAVVFVGGLPQFGSTQHA